jgi:beta-xylosidase
MRLMRYRLTLVLLLTITSCATAEPTTAPSDSVYLFTSFRGNGEDGLHLAWSTDALKWTPLNNDKSFLKPEVGKEKLMRDPCVVQGPDGTFQMVWTDSWHDRTIGYASSKDLIHWSKQKTIPVMEREPTAQNCWAPEVVYDPAKQQYLIFWATTIPGRFPETENSGDNNHRIYSTTTKDLETFTPTKLFYNPGFNVIDATMLVERADRVILIVKDETKNPVKKHLRVTTGKSIYGPFEKLSDPFTPAWVEGPTAIKIGDDYIVYYDMYRDHKYGAMRSKDLVKWEDITNQLGFPGGTRHGTVIRVPRNTLQMIEDSLKNAR